MEIHSIMGNQSAYDFDENMENVMKLSKNKISLKLYKMQTIGMELYV